MTQLEWEYVVFAIGLSILAILLIVGSLLLGGVIK